MVATVTVRVLHIDDEPAFADLQRTYLEEIFDTGLEVETVTDPAEGLAALDDRAVDCVVCDYDMPGMDGLELLERVREDRPALPFVLLTGRGSEAVASEAVRLGVTDYVPKPSGSKEYRTLANRIRSAVSQYRRGERARERAAVLRATCDRLPGAVVGLDADGTVTAVDADAEALLDRPAGDLRGTPVGETALAPAGSRFAEAVDEALADGETASVEGHSDALDRDLRVAVHPGPDGATVVATPGEPD